MIHKNLSNQWNSYSTNLQFGNIASEFTRFLKAREGGDEALIEQAKERLLELVDFTIADIKHRTHIQEVLRLRETIFDDTQSGLVSQYLMQFAAIARR